VRLVDLHAPHALRLDEHRVVERAHRRGVVARALHRDAQPVGAGEVHDRLDVGGPLGQRDHGRPLIRGEVPGLA
jgi:hypothetical protein